MGGPLERGIWKREKRDGNLNRGEYCDWFGRESAKNGDMELFSRESRLSASTLFDGLKFTASGNLSELNDSNKNECQKTL